MFQQSLTQDEARATLAAVAPVDELTRAIVTLRRRHGWTQTQFAEALTCRCGPRDGRINQEAVSRWERGALAIPADVRAVLAVMLERPLEWIDDRESEREIKRRSQSEPEDLAQLRQQVEDLQRTVVRLIADRERDAGQLERMRREMETRRRESGEA